MQQLMISNVKLTSGRPTPCGWLHHGSVSSPSGGGHYSVIIGYTDNAWIVHDPNGEADLVTGGYTLTILMVLISTTATKTGIHVGLSKVKVRDG